MLIKLNNWVFVQIVACSVLFACVCDLASVLQVAFGSVVPETTAVPDYFIFNTVLPVLYISRCQLDIQSSF